MVGVFLANQKARNAIVGAENLLMGFIRIQDGGNISSKDLWVNPARLSEYILCDGQHFFSYSNQ